MGSTNDRVVCAIPAPTRVREVVSHTVRAIEGIESD